MAKYTSILKNNVFLTMDEVADWVNIKPEQYAVPPEGAKASLIVQDILYSGKSEGITANSYEIEYLGGATAGSEVVSLAGNKIIVQIQAGVSTALQIKTAVEAHAVATLVDLTYIIPTASDQATVEALPQALFSAAFLSGGVVDVPFEDGVEKRLQIMERVLNSACAKVESMIDGPILVREFTEILDADGSDTIIPSHYPIREVVEVRYDPNRIFGVDTIIFASDVVLRGVADINYPNDIQFSIRGSDIVVVRGTNVGLMVVQYSMRGIGALKVTYKAGLGDFDEVPFDIKQAAILLFEYYYKQRENGLLGLMSKTTRGETAMKFSNGVPKEVEELVNPHIDYSFGTHNRMQGNS